MATNDLLVTVGTQLTLEGSGGSLTDGSFGAANDDTITTSDDANYPFLQFLLSVTFATGPTAGLPVILYQRRLNVESTNDAPVPDASYPHEHIGSFKVDGVTTAQFLTIDGIVRPINQEAEYYIENQAGQTISAAWTLKATPYTFIPAA